MEDVVRLIAMLQSALALADTAEEHLVAAQIATSLALLKAREGKGRLS
jgi:hypothetical protein